VACIEAGELLLRGGTGFLGYWNKPDKTAESADRDGWFAAGDAVRRTERGEIVFLDRVEHLVKLASGHPYPPQFIETRLRFSPFIKDVMVLGDETPALGGRADQHRHGCGRALGRGASRIAFSTFTDLSQTARGPRRGARRDRASTACCRGLARRALRQLPEGTGRRRGRADAHAQAAPRVPASSATARSSRACTRVRTTSCKIDITVTYQDGRKGELRAQVRL
jgi:long-chain acyl-CoA synthetase